MAVFAVVVAALGGGAAGSEPSPFTVAAGVPYGPDAAQVADVWRPAGVDEPPVVVWIHGGGWVSGSRSDVPRWVLEAAGRAGMAVVSIDYRLAVDDGEVTRDGFPTQSNDVDRALRWLRVHGSELGLDPSRLVVAGHSAGGHLAALAAAAPGQFRGTGLDDDLAGADPAPTAALIVAGPSDLEARAERWTADHPRAHPFSTCAGRRSESCWRHNGELASPGRWLGPGAPPAMLIYGANDDLVNATTHGRALADAWREAAGPAAVRFDVVDTGHLIGVDDVDVAAVAAWLAAVTA